MKRKTGSLILALLLMISGLLAVYPDVHVLAATSRTMRVGESLTIYATPVPANATGGQWSSNDTGKVEIVSQNAATHSCEIRALAKTSSDVYLEYRYKKSDQTLGMVGFYIKVTAPLPTAVSLSPSSLSLKVGESAQLTPAVTPAGAETGYIYSSDDEAIAKISKSGLVTAVGTGTTTVRVRTDLEAKKAACTVTVSAPPEPEGPSGGDSTESTGTGGTGPTESTEGTVPSDPEGPSGGNSTGSTGTGDPSEGTGPADTSDDGDSALTEFVPVSTVPFDQATDIAVSQEILVVYGQGIVSGDHFSGITLKDNTAGGNAAFTGAISGSALVLTPVPGLLAGHSYTVTLPAGALKLVAGNGVSAAVTFSFTVRDEEAEVPDSGEEESEEDETGVTGISISAPSKKIAAGKKVALKAKVTPKNATNQGLRWKSGNTKYATVSSKGVVTTKKAGAGKNVTITATATDGSGKKASIKIRIMRHAVTGVQIRRAPKNLAAGKSIKLRTTVRTNGKDANKTLKWTSSNTKYATVTSDGKVKAKKAGKGKVVSITAAATDGSGKKATVRIRIK